MYKRQVESEGRINKDVNFAGKVFPANEDLSGSYKFNSYRLTYRYDFVQNPNLEFGLGFTAKIRAVSYTHLTLPTSDLV